MPMQPYGPTARYSDPMKATMTAEEYRAWLKNGSPPLPYPTGKPAEGKNKYGAKRTVYNGRTYDSILEADYARHLDMRVKDGTVRRVQAQYRIPLVDGSSHIADYHADFRLVMADGSIEFHEAKGRETPVFKVKWRLLKAQLHLHQPGGRLVMVKRGKGAFEVVDEFTAPF